MEVVQTLPECDSGGEINNISITCKIKDFKIKKTPDLRPKQLRPEVEDTLEVGGTIVDS